MHYYVIDFGHSHCLRPGEVRGPGRWMRGQDTTVPEQHDRSDPRDWDLFPVDIYALGSLFRRNLLYTYTGLEDILRPLVRRMIAADPCARPDAHSVKAELSRLLAEVDSSQTPRLITLLRHDPITYTPCEAQMEDDLPQATPLPTSLRSRLLSRLT